MRIRTVKPEFWTHPILAKLDDGARLMAVGLLNLADDEGYFLAHPTLVRNALRAFDEDSTKTRRALETLSKVGWIDIREHEEHGQIGKVVNFLKHQRIDRATPSKLSTYFDSTSPRRALDEPSLLEGKGREQGMEGKGKDVGESAKPSPTSDEDFIASMETNEAFRGLDVRKEFLRMRTWCEVNGKRATRRRFVNWLNRADKSISVASSKTSIERDWSQGEPQFKIGTEFPEDYTPEHHDPAN